MEFVDRISGAGDRARRAAMKALNGSDVGGRPLTVNEAKAPETSRRF